MAVDISHGAVRRGPEVRREHLPPGGRTQGARLRGRAGPGAAAGAADRQQAAAAGAQEPALQRLQVHRAGPVSPHGDAGDRAGWNPEQEMLNAANAVVAFSVTRHRHRHPQGEARRHLRGVPAGRHRHQPEVRRHRPGPLDQPADHPPPRRRDPDRERAGRGQHLHPVPAGRSTRPPVQTAPARRPGETGAVAAESLRPMLDGRLARDARAGGRARGRPTTGAPSRPGDRVLLIAEDDPNFAQILLDLARDGASRGWSPAGPTARLRWPGSTSPTADHARPPAARRGRLDHPRPAQARPGHPPHPGPHHLGRRELAARPAARARSTS